MPKQTKLTDGNICSLAMEDVPISLSASLNLSDLRRSLETNIAVYILQR